MQLWVHTADAAVGNKLGFLDVRPDGAALSLIDDGKAQDARVGGNSLIKPAGNAAWLGWQAMVVDTDGLFQPVFTKNPTISGATPVGSVLTISPGTWTGNPAATPSYAWNRGVDAIIGANAINYTTVVGDTGEEITGVVTLTNTQGTDFAISTNFIIPT
jgi:hypothetical protein